MAQQVRKVVEMAGVSKEYALGEHTVTALQPLDLTIEEGAFVAIAGPSGSGKSTLLNLIGCIDRPTKGVIRIAGHDVSRRSAHDLALIRARNIGFVFQTFNLFPVLTAAENVEYPLLQMDEVDAVERRQRVAHFLDVVQLTKFARHRPNQLSGGQRQRVAIARALARKPKLVIADEPTANLDSQTGAAIIALMRWMQQKFAISFIFSSHDSGLINAADDLIVLRDGVIQSVRRKAEGARREAGGSGTSESTIPGDADADDQDIGAWQPPPQGLPDTDFAFLQDGSRPAP